jgi:hypothetical protein
VAAGDFDIPESLEEALQGISCDAYEGRFWVGGFRIRMELSFGFVPTPDSRVEEDEIGYTFLDFGFMWNRGDINCRMRLKRADYGVGGIFSLTLSRMLTENCLINIIRNFRLWGSRLVGADYCLVEVHN